MQIVINRSDLLAALKRSGYAINPKDMLSVRRCALIVGEAQSRITFEGGDGIIDIVCVSKGEVKRAGSAALDHHRLLEIASQLPDAPVEITVDAKLKVLIRSGASKRRFTMTALDASSYVTAPIPEFVPLYSVEAKILQQVASEVSFAVEKSAESQTPTGALLVPGEDKKFLLTAVNAHAMVVATAWFIERSSSEECLLPRNLLQALGGIPKDQIIDLFQDERIVYARTPDITIRAGRLQRPFPAVWKQASLGLPEHKRFRVSSEAFLESVRAVSAASDIVEGRDGFIQIDVTSEEGIVTVRTRASERTQGEDELPVSDMTAETFVFHANAEYLTQALRAFVPTELDLYYGIVYNQESLFLKNETLLAMVLLIAEVEAPPTKEKRK